MVRVEVNSFIYSLLCALLRHISLGERPPPFGALSPVVRPPRVVRGSSSHCP